MAAGLIWDRPGWDIFREVVIFGVLASLLIPAYKYKSIVTGVLICGICIVHVLCAMDQDPNLPLNFVLACSTVLALTGLYHNSYVITFAGFYSFLSKFGFGLGLQGAQLEIAKLLISIVVCAFALMLRSRQRRNAILRPFSSRILVIKDEERGQTLKIAK
jgi:hypothetical protein